MITKVCKIILYDKSNSLSLYIYKPKPVLELYLWWCVEWLFSILSEFICVKVQKCKINNFCYLHKLDVYFYLLKIFRFDLHAIQNLCIYLFTYIYYKTDFLFIQYNVNIRLFFLCTGMTVKLLSQPLVRLGVHFVANHPFVVFINSNNNILFVGRISEL